MTKLDRFARSVVGGLEDFARLRELGVGIVFLNLGVEGVDGGNDTLDTTTSTGELMFTMLLAFAQFERRLITERMDDGRRLKVAKNRNAEGRVTKWTGGHLPLGYVTDIDGRIVEDPEHSKTVKRIFALRADSMSTVAIARQLRDDGIQPRPRNGEVFNMSSDVVLRVLKTAAYLGNGVERRLAKDEEPILFDAPSLITLGDWERAHEFKGRKKVPKAGQKVHRYILSERINHGHKDGSTSGMFGFARPSGGVPRRWYRCSDARRTSTTEATCDGLGTFRDHMMTAVQADLAEAGVLEWVLTRNAADWEALVEAERRAHDLEHGPFDFEEAQARLARRAQRIQHIEDGHDAGLYTTRGCTRLRRQRSERLR